MVNSKQLVTNINCEEAADKGGKFVRYPPSSISDEDISNFAAIDIENKVVTDEDEDGESSECGGKFVKYNQSSFSTEDISSYAAVGMESQVISDEDEDEDDESSECGGKFVKYNQSSSSNEDISSCAAVGMESKVVSDEGENEDENGESPECGGKFTKYNLSSTSKENISSCAAVSIENKVVSDEDEAGESSECDSDGFYFHVPLPKDKDQMSSCKNEASCSKDQLQPKLSEVTLEDKGKVISFDDVYFDISKPRTSTNSMKCTDVDKIMKKSVIGPGFEQLKSVPPEYVSKRILQRERQINRSKSKGEMWFNMPKAEITPELKQDLEVLKMRSILDPKQFYKKNVMNEDPKYFHVATVVESPIDFYSGRIPKKQRKRTMVEELLADAEFQSYNKQRYKEIITERKRTTFKAFKHARRYKKTKGHK